MYQWNGKSFYTFSRKKLDIKNKVRIFKYRKNKSPTTKQHVKLILTCTVWKVRLGDKWARWSWRPVALQTLQSWFDSGLALKKKLYKMKTFINAIKRVWSELFKQLRETSRNCDSTTKW